MFPDVRGVLTDEGLSEGTSEKRDLASRRAYCKFEGHPRPRSRAGLVQGMWMYSGGEATVAYTPRSLPLAKRRLIV